MELTGWNPDARRGNKEPLEYGAACVTENQDGT